MQAQFELGIPPGNLSVFCLFCLYDACHSSSLRPPKTTFLSFVLSFTLYSNSLFAIDLLVFYSLTLVCPFTSCYLHSMHFYCSHVSPLFSCISIVLRSPAYACLDWHVRVQPVYFKSYAPQTQELACYYTSTTKCRSTGVSPCWPEYGSSTRKSVALVYVWGGSREENASRAHASNTQAYRQPRRDWQWFSCFVLRNRGR